MVCHGSIKIKVFPTGFQSSNHHLTPILPPLHLHRQQLFTMLFSNTISTLAMALALLAPVTTAMSGDFEIKFYSKDGCGGKASSSRDLYKGVCVALASNNHSLKVLDHRSGLKSKFHILRISSHQWL
jgi:hypothetical protein